MAQVEETVDAPAVAASKTSPLKGVAPKIGVDDGYAAIKVAWFGTDGKIQTLAVPSRATFGLSQRNTAGEVQNGYAVESGATFTVSHLVAGEDTRTPDYPVSDLNRVLVHHALEQAGFGGRPVRIGTTLPPGHLFKETGKNDKLEQAKKASLLRPVRSLSGKMLADIIEHEVYPEATVAMVDYCFDDNGNTVNEIHGAVAVVDIGGRTTDIAVILPDGVIDRARMRTENVGVLNVIDNLRDKIVDEYDLDGSDAGSIDFDLAVRTGSLTLHGRQTDITGAREEAINVVGSRILQNVANKIGGGASLHTVLFVGGGAELMKAVIQRYPNSVVHPQPQFANARGVLKAMKFG